MRENRVGLQLGGDRTGNDEYVEHEEGATFSDKLAGQ